MMLYRLVIGYFDEPGFRRCFASVDDTGQRLPKNPVIQGELNLNRMVKGLRSIHALIQLNAYVFHAGKGHLVTDQSTGASFREGIALIIGRTRFVSPCIRPTRSICVDLPSAIDPL